MNHDVLRKNLTVALFAIYMSLTFAASAQKAAIVQGEGDRTANIVSVMSPLVHNAPNDVPTIYTGPSGNVFVLEQIGIASGTTANGNGLIMITSPTAGTGQIDVPIAPLSGLGLFSNVQTTVRFPPGAQILAGVTTSAGTQGSAGANISLFGRLEPQ